MRRFFISIAIAIAISSGVAIVAIYFHGASPRIARADSSIKDQQLVQATNETTLPSGEIDAAEAKRIAENLAKKDGDGNPILSQPTEATLLSFQTALDAIGSSPDYSLDASADVWLVHTFGTFAGRRMGGPPPLPGETTDPTAADVTSSAPVADNYYIIINAATAQIVVENY